MNDLLIIRPKAGGLEWVARHDGALSADADPKNTEQLKLTGVGDEVPDRIVGNNVAFTTDAI